MYLVPNSNWNWSLARLEAPDVLCLYRLSTKNNQRVDIYFAKNTEPAVFVKTLFMEGVKHYSWLTENWFTTMCKNRNTATFAKTLFMTPAKTLFTTRKNIRELRMAFFSNRITIWERTNFQIDQSNYQKWISNFSFSPFTPLYMP